MAGDMERLIVSLEARTKAFETSLNKANATAQKRLKDIEGNFQRTNKNVSLGLGSLGKGLLGAYATKEFGQIASRILDTSTRIQNALKTTGLSGAGLEDVYDRLFASAQRNAAPIEALVDLYSKLSIIQNELGVSQNDLIGFTDKVALALRAGGTDATAASGALLQLSQALGSGTVRAEEFNSVLEGAPTIARAVAAGMDKAGGSVAKLRALVVNGDVSSREFFDAFEKGAVALEGSVATSTLTASQGFEKLQNAIIDVAKSLDAATGIGSVAGKTFESLARGVSKLADALKDLKDKPDTAISDQIADIGKRRLDIENQILKLRAEQSAAAEGWNPFSGVDNDQIIKDLEEENAALAEQEKRILAIVDARRKEREQAAFSDDERGSMLASRRQDAAYAKFISDRDADAKRTELEKDIDERAKKIMDAAEKIGVSMTEAAAKIQAKGEIAAETAQKTSAKSVSSAAELLKEFEGFRSKPYWDVNAYRVGYGSDTVTLDDGSIVKVTKGITVSLEGANRDLERRIGEFQKGIKGKIGADTFGSFNDQQQAVLTSIAYNYGSLPDRIAEAIKTGNTETIYNAIKGLGSDNGGMNRDRRNAEAQLFIADAPKGIKKAVDSREDFSLGLEEQRQQLAMLKEETGIRASLNPLVNDYGQKLTEVQKAQELLSIAQQEGTDAGRELSGVQQLLYGDLSALSPAAQAQAEAMRAIALGYGEAEAAGNRLAESQSKLQEKMSQSSAFGKDVLGGFIRDLRDGKSATEALSGALDKVADKLLDIALNSLFDGAGAPGGGGGILGGLFSFLFAAKGGVYANGKKQPLKTFAKGGVSRTAAIFGEAGPEAAVPLPDGRRIPVDLRGPAGNAKGQETIRVVLQDDSGRMAEIADSRIQTASGTIVQVSVQQSTKAVRGQFSGMLAESQTRRG